MQGMRVTGVLLSMESLNSGNVFILDSGRSVTLWVHSNVIPKQPNLGYSQSH